MSMIDPKIHRTPAHEATRPRGQEDRPHIAHAHTLVYTGKWHGLQQGVGILRLPGLQSTVDIGYNHNVPF